MENKVKKYDNEALYKKVDEIVMKYYRATHPMEKAHYIDLIVEESSSMIKHNCYEYFKGEVNELSFEDIEVCVVGESLHKALNWTVKELEKGETVCFMKLWKQIADRTVGGCNEKLLSKKEKTYRNQVSSYDVEIGEGQQTVLDTIGAEVDFEEGLFFDKYKKALEDFEATDRCGCIAEYFEIESTTLRTQYILAELGEKEYSPRVRKQVHDTKKRFQKHLIKSGIFS